MLHEMTTSTITHLCFGCEKCKGTEDELFVYIFPSYKKIYLGTKREKVYYFYFPEINKSSLLHPSSFSSVDALPKDRGVLSGRITSLEDLMKRIAECG